MAPSHRGVPALLQLLGSQARGYAMMRPPPPPKMGRIEGVTHTVAISSAKGGVGKSTTAVNLAVALTTSDPALRVGLLDADVFGPSLPRMLGLHASPDTTKEGKIIPLEAYKLKVMSMGLLLPEDKAAVWRGPMVMSAIRTLTQQVAWAPLDVLLLDMPPGTGDTQLSVGQQAALSGAVVVSTPQDIALIDARRGASMFRSIGVPLLGLVENMSHYVCPSCGHVAHLFGTDGCEKTAADLDLELLGKVPLHIAIRETSDEGTPIVAQDPASPHAQAYVSIAARIKQKLLQLPPRQAQ